MKKNLSNLDLKPSVVYKKTYEQISGVWIVKGPENNHEKAIKNIMNDPEVLEFDF